MPKVTPENVKELLPEGYRMKVHHVHEGNDPTGSLRQDIQDLVRDQNGYVGDDYHTPRYATVAHITRKNDLGDVEVLAEGVALCTAEDNPNRRLGWEIAATRAYINFQGGRY